MRKWAKFIEDHRKEPEWFDRQANVAYVKRYILALQDALKDLEGIRSYVEPEFYVDLGFLAALNHMKFTLKRSMTEAQDTLNAILNRRDDHATTRSVRERADHPAGPGEGDPLAGGPS